MHPQPSLQELVEAREAFEANEPRDLFYRAATELIALARQGLTSLSLAESLAVLLQTWNKSYYRFHRFDGQHFRDIERILAEYQDVLERLSAHTIEDIDPTSEVSIKALFTAFESALGPVGAAKCLHLLVPRLFPLWDRAIARVYRLPLGIVGTNAVRYWKFMRIAQDQCESLRKEGDLDKNPLKSIDEYNYCMFTNAWTQPKSIIPPLGT